MGAEASKPGAASAAGAGGMGANTALNMPSAELNSGKIDKLVTAIPQINSLMPSTNISSLSLKPMESMTNQEKLQMAKFEARKAIIAYMLNLKNALDMAMKGDFTPEDYESIKRLELQQRELSKTVVLKDRKINRALMLMPTINPKPFNDFFGIIFPNFDVAVRSIYKFLIKETAKIAKADAAEKARIKAMFDELATQFKLIELQSRLAALQAGGSRRRHHAKRKTRKARRSHSRRKVAA